MPDTPQRRRRPQINFQVDPGMKRLYEEAKLMGNWVTRWCAAGFLMMVENPRARQQALQRLREWEARYADASDDEIRAFVAGVESALRDEPRGSRRGRATRPGRAKARRSGS